MLFATMGIVPESPEWLGLPVGLKWAFMTTVEHLVNLISDIEITARASIFQSPSPGPEPWLDTYMKRIFNHP
jgi:hypothetical protein